MVKKTTLKCLLCQVVHTVHHTTKVYGRSSVSTPCMLNETVDESELLDLGFGHFQKVLKFPEGLSGFHSSSKDSGSDKSVVLTWTPFFAIVA